MESASATEDYGDGAYWNEYYADVRAKEDRTFTFDTLFDFDKCWATIQGFFGRPEGERVLVTGSGVGDLAKGLYEKGHRNITCIDISAFAVAHMQSLHGHLEGVDYRVGDIRAMEAFQDDAFSIILDKGTIDCLFCSLNESALLMALQECLRVLAPSGNFLCLSVGPPETRLPYFCHPSLSWGSAEGTLILGTGGDYMYIMKKRALGVSEEESGFDGAAIARKLVPMAHEIRGIRYDYDHKFRNRNANRSELLVGTLTRNVCRDAEDVWQDKNPYDVDKSADGEMRGALARAYAKLFEANKAGEPETGSESELGSESISDRKVQRPDSPTKRATLLEERQAASADSESRSDSKLQRSDPPTTKVPLLQRQGAAAD